MNPKTSNTTFSRLCSKNFGCSTYATIASAEAQATADKVGVGCWINLRFGI
jgi:hypothetical protein